MKVMKREEIHCLEDGVVIESQNGLSWKDP